VTRLEPPTLEEVAARAGVSRSTASRAINGGDRVSPRARAAVDAAVTELGFVPNRAARSLVTRRTDSIALVVPEPDEFALADPFVTAILTGLSASLADSELQVVLLMARPDRTERMVRFLAGGHVDGAVVVSHHRSGEVLQQLVRLRLPQVFVGRPLAEDVDVEYIDTDNVGGGRLAGQLLIDQGRRRIATITGPPDMAAGVDRLLGWTQALSQAGLPHDAVEHGDFTQRSGQAATHRLLDARPDTDAIFAASDPMAAGALAALAARGLRVPEDVAVIGYDDLGLATSTQPPLTTVVQPVVQMARSAARRLIDRLAGSPAAPPEVFPATIVERSTT
jgi:DNA-binding LacI/PurR family transcriptional regulator